MKEFFTDHSISLELKGIGFNEPCLAYFNEDKTLKYDSHKNNRWITNDLVYSKRKFINIFRIQPVLIMCTAPLFPQVTLWLQKKYKIEIKTISEKVISPEEKEPIERWYYEMYVNSMYHSVATEFKSSERLALLDGIKNAIHYIKRQ